MPQDAWTSTLLHDPSASAWSSSPALAFFAPLRSSSSPPRPLAFFALMRSSLAFSALMRSSSSSSKTWTQPLKSSSATTSPQKESVLSDQMYRGDGSSPSQESPIFIAWSTLHPFLGSYLAPQSTRYSKTPVSRFARQATTPLGFSAGPKAEVVRALPPVFLRRVLVLVAVPAMEVRVRFRRSRTPPTAVMLSPVTSTSIAFSVRVDASKHRRKWCADTAACSPFRTRCGPSDLSRSPKVASATVPAARPAPSSDELTSCSTRTAGGASLWYSTPRTSAVYARTSSEGSVDALAATANPALTPPANPDSAFDFLSRSSTLPAAMCGSDARDVFAPWTAAEMALLKLGPLADLADSAGAVPPAGTISFPVDGTGFRPSATALSGSAANLTAAAIEAAARSTVTSAPRSLNNDDSRSTMHRWAMVEPTGNASACAPASVSFAL